MRYVLAAVIVVVVVLVLFSLARQVWRFFRGDVELEPAGSFGRQFFGRDKDEKPDDYA